MKSFFVMKLIVPYAALIVCLGLSACSKLTEAEKNGLPKEVPTAVEAESGKLVSEAEFALQLRDAARAEKALSQAVKLRTDIPEWWMLLGLTQKTLGKTSDARASYKKALAIHERRYEVTGEPDHVLPQLLTLVLIGRDDDARALLAKAAKKHPTSLPIKKMVEAGVVDRMLADPDVQQRRI